MIVPAKCPPSQVVPERVVRSVEWSERDRL
jgi:hypothetical protein